MKSSKILIAMAAFAFASASYAGGNPSAPSSPQNQVSLSENFDDISTLAGNGWVVLNNSTPVGQGWFQGNDGIFAAHSGAANSYIAANFLTARGGVGTIDNWLITPVLNLNQASTLSFFTRTADEGLGDKLEVRFSSGNGTDVSTFTTVLNTVGEGGTYPANGFQQFLATLPVGGTGRIAFRYTGDAGNADYIGIDTVRVNAVPEPSTYAMMGLGLAALALARRKAKKA